MKIWKIPGASTYVYNELRKFKIEESGMYPISPLTPTKFMSSARRARSPTLIMSILNTTPDSFSDGGSNAQDLESLRATAAAHIAAGADIIDVGGQSSRPNAPDVSSEEEIARVLPAIAAIKSLPESADIAISVDTYRAAVAKVAVNAGAHIVNDISAGTLDPEMLSTVARLGCTYVAMHMRGTPATMQNPENCSYPDGIRVSVEKELQERVDAAIEAGIRRWRLILDPGIGFAKSQEQNLRLLRLFRLTKPGLKGLPLLFGSSRKGFIGKITGVQEPQERGWGTAVTVTAAIRMGASIVRVHDVKEMAQVAKMADAIYRADLDNWEDQ